MPLQFVLVRNLLECGIRLYTGYKMSQMYFKKNLASYSIVECGAKSQSHYQKLIETGSLLRYPAGQGKFQSIGCLVTWSIDYEAWSGEICRTPFLNVTKDNASCGRHPFSLSTYLVAFAGFWVQVFSTLMFVWPLQLLSEDDWAFREVVSIPRGLDVW